MRANSAEPGTINLSNSLTVSGSPKIPGTSRLMKRQPTVDTPFITKKEYQVLGIFIQMRMSFTTFVVVDVVMYRCLVCDSCI